MGPKGMTTAEFMALSAAGKAAAWRKVAEDQDRASDGWETRARKAEAAAETARRKQLEHEINARQCRRNAIYYHDIATGAMDAAEGQGRR